ELEGRGAQPGEGGGDENSGGRRLGAKLTIGRDQLPDEHGEEEQRGEGEAQRGWRIGVECCGGGLPDGDEASGAEAGPEDEAALDRAARPRGDTRAEGED